MVRAQEYTQFKPKMLRANQGQAAHRSRGERREPINSRRHVRTQPKISRQCGGGRRSDIAI